MPCPALKRCKCLVPFSRCGRNVCILKPHKSILVVQSISKHEIGRIPPSGHIHWDLIYWVSDQATRIGGSGVDSMWWWTNKCYGKQEFILVVSCNPKFKGPPCKESLNGSFIESYVGHEELSLPQRKRRWGCPDAWQMPMVPTGGARPVPIVPTGGARLGDEYGGVALMY